MVIPLPKKGNFRGCEHCRMMSLISYLSKVMVCIIINGLKFKADQLLSEGQADFRDGWSTVRQVFYGRDVIKKHLQHQRDLVHNFSDSKKVFDHIWHNVLWHILRGFNIEKGPFKSPRSSITMPSTQFS